MGPCQSARLIRDPKKARKQATGRTGGRALPHPGCDEAQPSRTRQSVILEGDVRSSPGLTQFAPPFGLNSYLLAICIGRRSARRVGWRVSGSALEIQAASELPAERTVAWWISPVPGRPAVLRTGFHAGARRGRVRSGLWKRRRFSHRPGSECVRAIDSCRRCVGRSPQ